MTSPIERAIAELLRVPDRRSVSPEEVARAVAGDDWRRVLPEVRATAQAMARNGEVTILRHGKPADPDDFRGVYRLGLSRG